MIKPLIQPKNEGIENENLDNEDIFSDSNGVLQITANSFAKLLGKKKFKKFVDQIYDDQIISVIQEVYLPPEERKDEVGDWILDRETSFLVHAAYKHRSKDIVLVCYRGTDFKNIKDLLSDVQIVLGVNGLDSRVQQSLDFYDDVQMKYPDAKKWICGHSLGGTLSYIVTKHRDPQRCVVFNPGASPTKTFIGMMKDTFLKSYWTRCITTYKIWGDIVSTLSFIGNVKNFTVKSANPLTLHSIDTFPGLFQMEKKNRKY